MYTYWVGCVAYLTKPGPNSSGPTIVAVKRFTIKACIKEKN